MRGDNHLSALGKLLSSTFARAVIALGCRFRSGSSMAISGDGNSRTLSKVLVVQRDAMCHQMRSC